MPTRFRVRAGPPHRPPARVPRFPPHRRKQPSSVPHRLARRCGRTRCIRIGAPVADRTRGGRQSAETGPVPRRRPRRVWVSFAMDAARVQVRRGARRCTGRVVAEVETVGAWTHLAREPARRRWQQHARSQIQPAAPRASPPQASFPGWAVPCV